MKVPVVVSWSGGKDSAMALYELQRSEQWQPVGLVTTVTDEYDRISMHGVRRVLLERQAAALGLPLSIVLITKESTNEEYESKMRLFLQDCLVKGISTIAFGDIFLEDLRKYREDNLALAGVTGLFPIWKRDTAQMAQAFIEMGFQATITCIDSQLLDKGFAGRAFDKELLDDLPAKVDPCGENGEFHSFVYDGPNLRHPIAHTKGEVVLRDGRYYFCDLVPGLETE